MRLLDISMPRRLCLRRLHTTNYFQQEANSEDDKERENEIPENTKERTKSPVRPEVDVETSIRYMQSKGNRTIELFGEQQNLTV